MNDDRPGLLTRHLLDAAKLRAPSASPSGGTGLVRRTAFHGNHKGVFWTTWAWSPDGTVLVAAGHDTKGGHAEGHAHSEPVTAAWDTRTGHERHHDRPRGVAGEIRSLAWSPDGSRLAAVELDAPRGAWSLQLRRPGHGQPEQLDIPSPYSRPHGLFSASHLAWHPEGDLIALTARDGSEVLLAYARTGQITQTIQGLRGAVTWSPDGALLAGQAGDTTVALADPVTGRVATTLGGHRRLSGPGGTTAPLAWSKDGTRLAVGDGADVHVWDARNATHVATFGWAVEEADQGPSGIVSQIEWLDDRHLAEFRPRGGRMRSEQADAMAALTLWDIQAGPLGYELLGTVVNEHESQIIYPATGFALAPDGLAVADFAPRRAPQTWTITCL
jgi:WD40 repeat protein